MPVTSFVGRNETKMQENIDTLKTFYGTMKGSSRYIHRSYITGVSKIGRIGILSDLNMLNDLTLDRRFATLFGYTETELRHYYADYITEGAEKYKMTEATFLGHIKHHYNGYSWDGIDENRVYNPFSLVNFFQSLEFRNYWFATGTPTVLTRGARKQQITIEDLENFKSSSDLLESANLKAAGRTRCLRCCLSSWRQRTALPRACAVIPDRPGRAAIQTGKRNRVSIA